MSIDFSSTVIIGPRKHDDQFYAKLKSIPGIEATDLFPIYERIGIGTYCDAVDLFQPASFCSVGENDTLCEDGSGLPAEAIMIAFERSGAGIGVASDGKTATFYTTFRSPDEAYRTRSFELALLKMAEGYGQVELFENPFYVTGLMGPSFTTGGDYRTNVAMVLAAIKEPAKVWACPDSHKEEESTFILDASKHLLVRVTDRQDDQVTLFADTVDSSATRSFLDAWHVGFTTKNLTPPQRPHGGPHLPPTPPSPTLALIERAYPEGVPARDYLTLAFVLARHLGEQSLDLAATPANDIADTPLKLLLEAANQQSTSKRGITQAAMDSVLEKLNRAGFQEWLAEQKV